MSSESEQSLLPKERLVGQEIILIAALAESNRVIGRELELPWHIPEDLKRFKRLTLGKPLVMGRTTYRAIIEQFGAPLKNRRTVVLSSRGAVDGLEGVETYKSIPEALKGLADEPEIYIGGGGGVYAQFIPIATKMELTLIEGDYEGDTYFPSFEDLVGDVFEVADEEQREGYRFVTYVQKNRGTASRDKP